MANIRNMNGVFNYLIFLDNVRVDHLVKSFSTSISVAGNMGTANVDFIYAPALYRNVSIGTDGIEDMTVLRIYIRNVVNGKYEQVFEGNVRGKSLRKGGGTYSFSIFAYDYTEWLNRILVPVSVGVIGTDIQQSEWFIWKAQGVNLDTVAKQASELITNFQGTAKTIKQYYKQLCSDMSSNELFCNPNSVSMFDNVFSRVVIMGDIDPEFARSNSISLLNTSAGTNINTIYVYMNRVVASFSFELFQDRDGYIKIKPSFLTEDILLSHVIDPMFLISYEETTSYASRVTRVVTSAGYTEAQSQSGIDALAVVAYLGDGRNYNSFQSSNTIATATGAKEIVKPSTIPKGATEQ